MSAASGPLAGVRTERLSRRCLCWHIDGMIAQNDKMVGELLEKLEEFALTSNTLVIYIAVSRHDIAAIWVAFFSR